MRMILSTILTIVVSASLPMSMARAAVVINMPPPRKAAPVNLAAAAAEAASNAGTPSIDVGDLALARYGGARTGTFDNYFNMPYRNYSYPWPYGWGVYGGWPFWGVGFGCVNTCSPSSRVCP